MMRVFSNFLVAAICLTVLISSDSVADTSKITSEEAIVQATSRFGQTDDGYSLRQLSQRVHFSPTGIMVTPRGSESTWNWRFADVNVEASSDPISGSAPHLDAATETVSYVRGPIIEQYIARHNGVEQQFVIPAPLDLADEALVIRGQIESSAKLEKTDDGWRWVEKGSAVTLGDVYVYDAEKKQLPAEMRVQKDGSQIVIAKAVLDKAVYPITIDPLIGSKFRISDMGPDGDTFYGAVSPSVAYSSVNDEYLVVWSGDDNTGSLVDNEYEIFGQRINAATGAEIGSDFRISDMGPDGDIAYGTSVPSVAYSSVNDEYLVVWDSDDNTGSLVDNEREIFGQRINAATGAEIGSDFRISDMGPDGNDDYSAFRPSVAYSSVNNEYLVVWDGDDNTGSLVDNEREIFGQRINATTGAEIGIDFRISDMGPDGNGNYASYGPSVAYSSVNNEYLVAWSGDDNTGSLVDNEREIFGQRINAATGAETGSNDFRISDMGSDDGDTNYGAYDSLVAYNSVNNEYLVVWSGFDNTGSLVAGEREIFGQRINPATGAEIGSNDFRISDMGPDGNDNYDASAPSVAYSSVDNEYLVAWMGDDNTGSLVDGEDEIFGQLINAATGAEIGSDFRISDMGPDGDVTYGSLTPSVAYSSVNNESLVVWRGDDDAGSLVNGESEVFGQLFASPYAEIEVSANGNSITDGDSTPSANDHTSFGNVFIYNGTINRTFTITNSGNSDAVLSGAPLVEIGGSGASSFTVIVEPLTPIVASGSTTITIQFDPSSIGTVQATVSIVSNDANENPYNFTIEGTGTAPEIDVSGNGTSITDGDSTPGETDHTSFGDVPAVSGAISRTFTISNTGDADLLLEGTPVVRIVGSGAGDFTVTSQASSPVTASGNTTFTIQFVPNASGLSQATVTIASSDSDETPFTFAIQGTGTDTEDADGDGVSDADEAAAGTDPNDSDSDDDGVNDGQEQTDGTNPMDRGSALEVLGTKLCLEWNGYLGGMWNIAEHVNMSSNGIDVDCTLYDIAGVEQSVSAFSVAGGMQQDLLVHDMQGWTLNSYGKMCSDVSGANAGDLDGRMVYYKEASGSTSANPSFEFAFAMPFLNGIAGEQFVPLNTFQPSLNSADADNLVANWIQLTNLEASAQSGTLTFYAEDGSVLGTQNVELDAGERNDYSGHQFGMNLVGLIRWSPDSSSAKFQLRNVRYFYDNPDMENSFASAFQLSGMVGSGETVAVPLDTTNGSSVVEVGNTTGSSVEVVVKLYDASGTRRSTSVLSIPAYGTAHVIADGELVNAEGIATIDGDAAGSVIAVAMQYARTTSLGIQSVYGISGKQALGTTLRGSYNTFLSQGCSLLIVNPTDQDITARIGMLRYDGTSALSGELAAVPSKGSYSADLCANDIENVYGVVTVEAETMNSLIGTVVRIGANDSYRFPVPLR